MFHGGRQLKNGKEKIGEHTSVSSRTSEAKVVLLALADGQVSNSSVAKCFCRLNRKVKKNTVLPHAKIFITHTDTLESIKFGTTSH